MTKGWQQIHENSGRVTLLNEISGQEFFSLSAEIDTFHFSLPCVYRPKIQIDNIITAHIHTQIDRYQKVYFNISHTFKNIKEIANVAGVFKNIYLQ